MRTLLQADVDKAVQQLRVSAEEEAKAKLRADINDSRFGEAAFQSNLVESKTSVSVGDEADGFLCSVKVSVTGVFYSKPDMESLVRQRIMEKVPQGREVVSQEPTKITSSISGSNVASENADLSVSASILTKVTSAEGLVSKEAILGLPIPDAQKIVEQIKGIESAEIIVKPDWVRRLPTLADHVTVKIK